jgi:dsDNA-specific endonuclease/ATPase MutS2
MSDLEDDLNEALDERDEALRLLSEEQELRKRAEREVTEVRQVLHNMLATVPASMFEDAHNAARRRERDQWQTYDQYARSMIYDRAYIFKDMTAS